MNTRVILKNIPQDLLQLQDFEVVDELLRPALRSGQMLVKVEWVSVDQIQRAWLKGGNIYMQSVKPGECVAAYGVGVVIDSRDSLFRVGNRVVGKLGWQMYAIVNSYEVSKVPYYEKPQLYLSVLGIPGLTAYFGLIDLGKPKKNEVVLVSSAAGAVGSILCQLAKMKECTVIGLAGSDKKCNYVTSVLGASACINHRKVSSLSSVLSSLCPAGIDIYFDTVGGYILDTVLLHLNKYSRILLSEASSTYNTLNPHPLYNYPLLIANSVTVEGFSTWDFKNRFGIAITNLSRWYSDGKIQHKEIEISGLANAPGALLKLLEGRYMGKVIVNIEGNTARL